MADLIDQTAINVRLAGGAPHALQQADSTLDGRRYQTVCGRLFFARRGAVLTTRDVECEPCTAALADRGPR